MVSGISQEVVLLVEIAPGRLLTGLTEEIYGTDGVRCFPVASKSGRDEDFNVALAAMYVHGAQVRWNELFDGRFVREFVPADQTVFIENLAEATLPVTSAPEPQIGRASWRERVCQDVYISVVAVSLKKKKKK